MNIKFLINQPFCNLFNLASRSSKSPPPDTAPPTGGFGGSKLKFKKKLHDPLGVYPGY